jgi:hypothetical protein
MGGSRHLRTGVTHPMALLSAVATLFAALFICLGPAEPGHPDGSVSFTATQTTRTTQADTWYLCPYDRGGCGLLPQLNPAVLTAPPPAAPLTAGVQLHGLGLPHPIRRLPRSAVFSRAPGLHVLQVLRT